MEMGFKAFLIVMISAVVVAPALATDYMVGENEGWKIGVNYTTWAHGKDFRVGDTIMFMYNKDNHNVIKVNGTDFKNCANTNASATPYKSGQDSFTLSSPGKEWYICGVKDHCAQGMKLVITVSADGPTPSPVPGSPNNSAAGELSPMKAFMWMLASTAAYKMIMA